MSVCNFLSSNSLPIPLLKSSLSNINTLSKVEKQNNKIKQAEHLTRGTIFTVDSAAQASVSNSAIGLQDVNLFSETGNITGQISAIFPNGTRATSEGTGKLILPCMVEKGGKPLVLEAEVSIFDPSSIRENLLNPAALLASGAEQGRKLEVVLQMDKVEVRDMDTKRPSVKLMDCFECWRKIIEGRRIGAQCFCSIISQMRGAG